MTKIYLLLLAGLLSTMALSAQITIENTDIPPFGAVLSFGEDLTTDGLEPGPSGADQNWDFSGLSTNSTFQNSVIDPAETPFAADFSDATFTLFGTDGFYTFAQLTSDALIVLGGSGAVPGGGAATARFDHPQQLLPAPAIFGSSFENDFGFNLKLDGSIITTVTVDSVEIRESGTQSAEIDGWGTLTIPSGTYETLRQRVETVTRDSFFALFLGNWFFFSEAADTVVTYEWWAKDGRSRVLSLEYDLSGNPLSAIHLSGYSESMVPPVAAFSYELLEDGEVQFTDETEFGPAGWLWNFGDGTTSLEQNPRHTYSASGIYEACLTVANGAGQDETCQQLDIVISSDEEALAATVRAYPSPFSENLNVELGALAGRAIRLSLFNSLGQLVKQERLEAAPPLWKISATELLPGVYQLVVEVDGKRVKVLSVSKGE